MEFDSQLIERVRSGDRQALAEFVKRHEDLIRARFRDGFAAVGSRLNDSSDFFATVMRRFDGLFASRLHAPRPETDSMYAALELIMIEAATDYSRAAMAEHADLGLEAAAGVRSGDAALPAEDSSESAALATSAGRLASEDQQILRLRVDGSSHQVIAHALGMSVEAVRMRWHRIARKLRGDAGAFHA